MPKRRMNYAKGGAGDLPPIPLRPPKDLGLTPVAEREWRRIARILRERSIGTVLDVGVLAAYCFAFARMLTAEKALRERGLTYRDKNGDERRHPLLMAARAAAQDMARFAGELGLSPAARLRVSYDGAAEDWQSFFDGLAGDPPGDAPSG